MKAILGIDVGGSGIKAALVDTEAGKLRSERFRVDTPQPSKPDKVAKAIKKVVAEFSYSGPVGCCFPSVIIRGEARTAGNIHKSWRGTPVDSLFADSTGLPFTVLNDADAAGIAEMELGAGRDLDGMVIMVTIGTGLGTGVFYNRELIPNIELGAMTGRDGEFIERFASNSARKRDKLSYEEWGPRFNFFLQRVARTHSPDHFIIGGGASKKYDRYRDAIKVRAKIHVAHFKNNAGIIGAAAAAAS